MNGAFSGSNFFLPEILQGIGSGENLKLYKSSISKRNATPPAKLIRGHDYIQDGLHLTAAAGLAVAAGLWAGPVTLAACAGVAGVFTIGGFKLADKFMPKMFIRRKITDKDVSGLNGNLKEFTRRAGLSHKPVLYDFELNKEELKKREDKISTAPPQLNRVINAAAVSLAKPVIIISEPLLKLMEPKETRSVVAHEFTHLGAHHTMLRLIAGWLQTTTMFTAMFGMGAVVVSQGWWVGLISIAGAMGIASIGNKLMPKKEDRYTRDGTVKPRARRTQLAIWAGQEALSVGLLAIPNPVSVLTAVAIEHGFFWAANLIIKSLSRRQEFQADRGAVALGADPLALITSLRKMEAVLKRDEPELALSRDWRRGSLLSRGVKMVASVLKTHPDTVRRCRRLAGIAVRQGVPASKIQAAMSGPLDISALPPREGHQDHSDGLADKFMTIGLVRNETKGSKITLPDLWRRGYALATPRRPKATPHLALGGHVI